MSYKEHYYLTTYYFVYQRTRTE